MGGLNRNRIPEDVDSVRAALRDVLSGIDGASQYLGLLEATSRVTGDRAKVVFAGEILTGKTSLINALLNRAQLLPVGADGPTTTTYVAVTGDATEGLHVELRDGHTTVADLAAADRYICSRGDSAGEIVSVSMTVDDPRLSKLSLIDTPGIGNPSAAFGRLILDALSDATALVFVCAAGNKISTAERNFIAEAARRIDRIVFVLNRIDVSQHWRDSVRENEDTVRADQVRFPDGRFADITFIPVSARKALEPALRKRSGIDELWEQLRSITDQHTDLARLNQLRMLRSMISDVQAVLEQRLKSLNETTGAEAAVLEEQLSTLSAQDKAWRAALKSEVVLAKNEVQRLIEVHKMELRTDFDDRTAAQSTDVDELEAGLVAGLCGMQLQADRYVREHTAEIARRLLTGLPGTDSAVEALNAQLPDPSTSISAYLRERPARAENPMEKLTDLQTTLLGWGTTYGAASIVISVVTGGSAPLFAAAFGVPGALLWRRWAKQVRDRSAEATHTKSWVNDQIAHATRLIEKDINQAFTNAETQLRKALEVWFTDARKELEDLRRIKAKGREEVDKQKRQIQGQQSKLYEAGHGCDIQLRAAVADSTD